MGVQAAVASGLGISLLPSDAVLPEHQQLGPRDGYDDQPPSEIALSELPLLAAASHLRWKKRSAHTSTEASWSRRWTTICRHFEGSSSYFPNRRNMAPKLRALIDHVRAHKPTQL
jgi:hypothetical protein